MLRILPLLALFLVITPLAHADVLPIYDAPHQVACQNKKAGDACTFKREDKTLSGACVSSQACSVNATAQHYYEEAMRNYKPSIPKPGDESDDIPSPPTPPKERCVTVVECVVPKVVTPPKEASKPNVKSGVKADMKADTGVVSKPMTPKKPGASCATIPALPAPAAPLALGFLLLWGARRRS